VHFCFRSTCGAPRKGIRADDPRAGEFSFRTG